MLKTIIKAIFLASSIAILCAMPAHAKKITCTGNDWVKIGKNTALSGQEVRTFDKYKAKCGSKIEDEAQSLYLDGYTAGVMEFCTFDKGYEYGSSKRKMPEVCPYEVRENFVKGYNRGAIELREKLHRLKRAEENKNDVDVRDQPSKTYSTGITH